MSEFGERLSDTPTYDHAHFGTTISPNRRRMDERPCRQPYVFGPLILLVLPTRVANSNSSSKAKSIKFCSQIGRCKAKPITRHFSGQNVKSVEAKYLVGQALIQIPMQFQLSIQFYGAFKGTWDFFYFNRTKKKIKNSFSL